MPKLTEYTRYADAQKHADSRALWALFDGNKDHFNITHECIVRHADGTGRPAVRIAHASGTDTALSFDEIAAGSARFAHWLEQNGIKPGDRIAFMLEPSLPFYVCLFGAMLRGAISVPLFTLFGLDGLRLRVDDCKPKLLITNEEKVGIARQVEEMRVVVADRALLADIARFPPTYKPRTRSADMAVFQYTSGTTRELPAAVKHTHRTVVTLMFAALYGTGIRPGDQFFCPSSPAWGHGLWHGTLAPLALGVSTGTFAGRFDAARLMKGLQDYKVTNLSAAATHYRMMKNSGRAGEFEFAVKKLSFTGEPIDPATLQFIDQTFRVPACSMYGTTEIGVVLVNYPGAPDYNVKPGSLGKAVPGLKLMVQKPDGSPTEPDEVGELMLWRRDKWESTKDLAKIDADGYFYHAGRADDAIISAGWTMSAVEIISHVPENSRLDVSRCPEKEFWLREPHGLHSAAVGRGLRPRTRKVQANVKKPTVDDSSAEDTGAGMRYRAPALEKGLDILTLLAGERMPLTLSTICQRLDRSQGEIFRMVQVLQARGFVEQDAKSDGYVLTDLLFSMAMRQPATQSLVEIAIPVMRNLATDVGQSCHLVLHSRGEIVVVARMESMEQIGFSVRVGYRLPITQAVSGIMLFAFQPEDVRARWLEKLDPQPSASELKKFVASAEAARDKGFTRGASTFVGGITDISAPILRGDRAAAALTVPFIKTIQSRATIAEVTDKLRAAAAQISNQLSESDNRA
jgi:acetyl-CoA synthetase